MHKENCQECGAPSDNSGSACMGAISQQYPYVEGDNMDTTLLITCNCCDECRWECHYSFMDSVEAGEQEPDEDFEIN